MRRRTKGIVSRICYPLSFFFSPQPSSSPSISYKVICTYTTTMSQCVIKLLHAYSRITFEWKEVQLAGNVCASKPLTFISIVSIFNTYTVISLYTVSL